MAYIKGFNYIINMKNSVRRIFFNLQQQNKRQYGRQVLYKTNYILQLVELHGFNKLNICIYGENKNKAYLKA